MDILLKVYQNGKAEVNITSIHIKAFFLDLFIAGTDTAAETQQWTIAELINHPDAFKKLRQEIESVVGRNRLVEESVIPKPFLFTSCSEGDTRTIPSRTSNTRECRVNCKIIGLDIPEKTAVAINLYAIMRYPESWENPNEFRPDRFLVSSEEQDDVNYAQNETKGQKFNFVPLEGGRSGCLGSTQAFTVMHTVIADMVHCFDWKVGGNGDRDRDGDLG